MNQAIAKQAIHQTDGIPMTAINDYRYLWDGSEPNWVLIPVHRQTVRLRIVFGAAGPCLREIAAIRRAVPEYTALPTSAVLEKIRATSFLDLGEFESRDARRIAGACKANHLEVQEQVQDWSGYLPMNEKTGMCLLIDDNVLENEVCEEALKRGVRIRGVET